MSDDAIPTKGERLKEFYARIAAAPTASNADEAFVLLCNTLNAVEEQLTGIPFNPANWKTDGRMYPPQSDNESTDPARPGTRVFKSFRHTTIIGANGSIEISDRATGEIVFLKNGGGAP